MWNNDVIKKIKKDLEDPYALIGYKKLIIKELKKEGAIKRLSNGITSEGITPEEQLIHDMYYHESSFFGVLSVYFKDVNPSMLYKSEFIRKMALVLLLKEYNLNHIFEEAISWKKEGINLSSNDGDMDIVDLFAGTYNGTYKVDFYFGDKYLCSDKIWFSYEDKKSYDLEKMPSVYFYEIFYRSDNFADALINEFVQEIGFENDVQTQVQMTNKKIEELERTIREYKTEIDRLKNSAVSENTDETTDETVEEEKTRIKVPVRRRIMNANK